MRRARALLMVCSACSRLGTRSESEAFSERLQVTEEEEICSLSSLMELSDGETLIKLITKTERSLRRLTGLISRVLELEMTS